MDDVAVIWTEKYFVLRETILRIACTGGDFWQQAAQLLTLCHSSV